MSPLEAVLLLILPPALIGWIFRRLGLADVVGFVIGGLASYALLTHMQVEIEELTMYIELMQQLGLILFFFEIGSSINLRGIIESSYMITSSELVLLILTWISTGLISAALGASFYERMLLFILFLNSSTVAIISMRRLKLSGDIFERAALQTSLEDLVQFSLFATLLLSAPTARTLDLALELVVIAGKALIVFLVARTTILLLNRSPFIKSREDKFFAMLIIAAAFSVTSSFMGLPELFGAFIAGLASSLYLSLDDIRDLLGGIRDLGLLLYFASIGLFIAPWAFGVTPNLLLASIIIGVTSMFIRALGLSLGLLLSGGSVYSSVLTAIILSQMSETGVVFAHMMYSAGIANSEFVVLVIISVLFTLSTSSVLSARAPYIALKIESRIPTGLYEFLQATSRIFFRRVETLVKSLSLLTWFSASALLITTVTSLITNPPLHVSLPPKLVLAIAATAILILFVIHASFAKLISDLILDPNNVFLSKPLRALEALLDVTMGSMILALQVYLISEYVARVSHAIPYFESLAFYAAAGVAIVATAVNIIKQAKHAFKPATKNNVEDRDSTRE